MLQSFFSTADFSISSVARSQVKFNSCSNLAKSTLKLWLADYWVLIFLYTFLASDIFNKTKNERFSFPPISTEWSHEHDRVASFSTNQRPPFPKKLDLAKNNASQPFTVIPTLDCEIESCYIFKILVCVKKPTKANKKLFLTFSQKSDIMALYYAGRIAVPSTSKQSLHDRFTSFMKNRPSKLVRNKRTEKSIFVQFEQYCLLLKVILYKILSKFSWFFCCWEASVCWLFSLRTS